MKYPDYNFTAKHIHALPHTDLETDSLFFTYWEDSSPKELLKLQRTLKSAVGNYGTFLRFRRLV
jgi:hypothetical protein